MHLSKWLLRQAARREYITHKQEFLPFLLASISFWRTKETVGAGDRSYNTTSE